jgi:hypothetical protein
VAASSIEAVSFEGGLRVRLVERSLPTHGDDPERVAETIVFSPELVLVCPVLRELALEELNRGGTRGGAPEAPLIAASREPISPQGAMQEEDGRLPVERAGAAPLAPPRAEIDSASIPADSARRLALAVVAYAAAQAGGMILYGAAVFAAITVAVVLAAYIHG